MLKRNTVAGLLFGEVRIMKVYFFWERNLLLVDSYFKRYFFINYYNLKIKCFEIFFVRLN